MTNPNIPEEKTIPIADSGNQGGIRMWPSEEWASKLADWANVGLIASLIAGVISTALLVWMGNVKEAYLKIQLGATNDRATHAEERAANVEAGNIQLRIDLSMQQERAANAEESLLELRERIKGRHLSSAAQQALTGKLLPFARQLSMLVTLAGDPEIAGIGRDLIAAIKEAHWNLTTVLGNAPKGEVHSGIVIEVDPEAPESAIKAANVLASALRSAGLATDGPKPGTRTLVASGATFSGSPPVGNINLITVTIAKKP